MSMHNERDVEWRNAQLAMNSAIIFSIDRLQHNKQSTPL